MKKRFFMMSFCLAALLAACQTKTTDQAVPAQSAAAADAAVPDAQTQAGTVEETDAAAEKSGELERMDMSAWQYDESHDVYWQTGIAYCAFPADEGYETMGVYVPGAYMDGEKNADGSYTCTVKEDGEKGKYTSKDAPAVLPVNTPGYMAMDPPTGYDESTSAYTDEGFIYIWPGCRGRDAGAPAGVTDLKAAIRFYRYNSSLLPGDAACVFSFGMSGGGAQSAILGASGDAREYSSYLLAIGAAMGQSDAVKGAMCWCPITDLDTADAAYEWNLGNTRADASDDEKKLSDALASTYAEYINSLDLTAEDGTKLTLDLPQKDDEELTKSGTYYDYLMKVIEGSLENFLEDTEFPYDTAAAGSGGMGAGGPVMAEGRPAQGGPEGEKPADADMANAPADMADAPAGMPAEAGENAGAPGEEAAQFARDGIDRQMGASEPYVSGVFDTPKDYIDALNADGEWVSIRDDGSVSISSIYAFTSRMKKASKGLAAFDQLDCGQGENTLFGYGDGKGAHFDSTLAGILADMDEYGDTYAEFEKDLQRKDALGVSVQERLNMYTPLYYISDAYKNSGQVAVAPHWRIRTGINQGDTALCTEVNLALALKACDGVEDVDFETVWGQGHTMAERTGSSEENFIAWVHACMDR